MNSIMMEVGRAITRFLIENFPREYLAYVFSEDMGMDDLVDQVLLELVKYAYYETAEKHSLRYYLNRSGRNTDDVKMMYSRLIRISNEYKEKELDTLEMVHGVSLKDARPPRMGDISEKLDGYSFTEMNFFELTNIGELELIKAILKNRLDSAKKTSNTRFREIAGQYDKMVVSLREQVLESDEKMVFSSLAYFSLEWKYAFHIANVRKRNACNRSRDDCNEPCARSAQGTFRLSVRKGLRKNNSRRDCATCGTTPAIRCIAGADLEGDGS